MNGRDQVQNGLDSIIAGVHKTQGRYVNEFMSCGCAPDLIGSTPKIYPSGTAAKELTESMGAYSAVRRRLGWDLRDKTITAFVVGDGCTPRTGALLAYRSAWSVYSIDPMLRRTWPKIQRLTTIGARIEDAGPFELGGDAVIIGVHSHARLEPCIARIRPTGQLAVIVMPCCIELTVEGVPPDVVYDDLGVWSPKRQIKIWKNILPSERDKARDRVVAEPTIACGA